MDHTTSVQYQVQLFFHALVSFPGMIALAVGLALALWAMVSKKGIWTALAILLWVSSLETVVEPWLNNTLAFPLEQIRHYGRPLVAALLLILLVPVFTWARQWRRSAPSGPLLLLLLFEVVFILRIGVIGLWDRAVFGLVVYLLIFIIFGIGLTRWLVHVRDAQSLVGVVVAAGLLFVLGTVYQLLINHHAIVWQGRLMATTGNPQHAAVLLGLLMPPSCYLLVRPGQRRLVRLLMIGLVGVLTVLLVWTGSRTGELMALVGLAIFFRARLGRMALVVIGGGIVTLVVLQLLGPGVMDPNRLLSLQDTRSSVWLRLTSDFLSHPLLGGASSSITRPPVGENSYLSVAGFMGLSGLLPLAAWLIVLAWQLMRLYRLRHWLGEHRLLMDLVLAGFAAIFAGAMFEGFLLAMLAFPLFFIYLYLGLTAFLVEAGELVYRQSAASTLPAPGMSQMPIASA